MVLDNMAEYVNNKAIHALITTPSVTNIMILSHVIMNFDEI